MQSIHRLADHLVNHRYFGVDRRSKPRIYAPFPLLVQGMDASGRKFRRSTVVDNLSVGGGGLYLRLVRDVEPGTKLFVIVQLSTASGDDESRPSLAAIGQVLRVEPKPGGVGGYGIRITRQRLL